jgi:transaldolase
MTSSSLHTLRDLGQSPWLDSITREWLLDGTLERWIDEYALTGVTSNPSIFAQALSSAAYDDDIAKLAADGLDDRDIFETLATDDIRDACDLFLPVYERSGGTDGFVSIEVEPDLAHDTQATVYRARTLHARVDRPNVMVKVPATPAGLPAIEQLLFDGININITLLFSVSMYREVMDCHLRALERRLATGSAVHDIASVASFFVSRVDTAVDAALDGASSAVQRACLGRTAVANAVVACAEHAELLASDRWRALAREGARVQRPLWASTGTKNSAYSDIVYVQELIAPGTVNTMPLSTIEAFADHGIAQTTITPSSIDDARNTLETLAGAGVDLDTVTDALLAAGVRSFATSYDELLGLIAARRSQTAPA